LPTLQDEQFLAVVAGEVPAGIHLPALILPLHEPKRKDPGKCKNISFASLLSELKSKLQISAGKFPAACVFTALFLWLAWTK